MCEYCKNIFTESDYTDLFEFPIRVNVGDTEREIQHRIGYFSAGIVAQDDESKPVIEATVSIGEMVCSKYIPIKYCPICGQDLIELLKIR